MNIFQYYFIIFVFVFSCSTKEETYLNINQSVDYVGMNKCATCHYEKYQSFSKSGMGSSFKPALKEYSQSIFDHILYDSILRFSYNPYWIKDSLFINLISSSDVFPFFK